MVSALDFRSSGRRLSLFTQVYKWVPAIITGSGRGDLDPESRANYS